MEKEALIKLIWLGIITGWEEFIEDMKKELWIDDESKCEETEEQINARFLRWKQDEIDNLRNEIKRLESKVEIYSNALKDEIDKRIAVEKELSETEVTISHRDSILSKAYDLIAYPGLSDTKKIDILRKVINIEVGASYEPDEDVTNFHKRIYKCKKWPQWVTWASN